ncbi:helix-turn-helix transcriptional regulator [Nonomuraea aurantiaca]|uniref:helix-turn-helix transcriptional regulator n=1 Tax=Nonomuraea aurantiaca TaxID=2878562 RepID=UPI001CDA4268|nr:WYL domain-containing protein [Nonomuraea aurantiaca]MCA2223987.1 WYL domain-containing protein [Nonomuraea aurantiaca]
MTSSRLLDLLSLLQIPREWPGGELAERLGVSRRTIRRDIDRLRDLGYPVDATMGADGGYRLAAGTAMPPLLLDDDEAVAIAVGLATAARNPVRGIAEASVRALAKLGQVLPARLRHRVSSLTAATVPLPAADGPDLDPEQLTTLAAAIANRERVRFGYPSADGADSSRLVDPYRLVPAGRRWYLLGYDNDRDDWRIFRIDRISRLMATGARVTPRDLPATDAAAYVADRLYSLVPTYEAVVTVHAPAADVARRLGAGVGELTPIGERTCRLRCHADTLEWLAFRLTLLACDFEVHEPAELTGHLRAIAARLTRAAGPGPLQL